MVDVGDFIIKGALDIGRIAVEVNPLILIHRDRPGVVEPVFAAIERITLDGGIAEIDRNGDVADGRSSHILSHAVIGIDPGAGTVADRIDVLEHHAKIIGSAGPRRPCDFDIERFAAETEHRQRLMIACRIAFRQHIAGSIVNRQGKLPAPHIVAEDVGIDGDQRIGVQVDHIVVHVGALVAVVVEPAVADSGLTVDRPGIASGFINPDIVRIVTRQGAVIAQVIPVLVSFEHADRRIVVDFVLGQHIGIGGRIVGRNLNVVAVGTIQIHIAVGVFLIPPGGDGMPRAVVAGNQNIQIDAVSGNEVGLQQIKISRGIIVDAVEIADRFIPPHHRSADVVGRSQMGSRIDRGEKSAARFRSSAGVIRVDRINRIISRLRSIEKPRLAGERPAAFVRPVGPEIIEHLIFGCKIFALGVRRPAGPGQLVAGGGRPTQQSIAAPAFVGIEKIASGICVVARRAVGRHIIMPPSDIQQELRRQVFRQSGGHGYGGGGIDDILGQLIIHGENDPFPEINQSFFNYMIAPPAKKVKCPVPVPGKKSCYFTASQFPATGK
ncbi:hypothetical protein SDC9_69863 [bioreactor metagenome]|uniref:Uncharacterized protein n=1 Tax=bioreactor metagenome TaxID=1076179 RepID=A0A644Y621_9ZZZZ